VTSEQAYDRLAPHYRGLAQSRATYLDAVDGFVIERAARGAHVLDVGAGDGMRGMRIARAIDARRVVLSEPSAAMVALCRTQGANEVWRVPAQKLPETAQRFDVILCLWNVLGHLPDRESRVAALQSMRRLLAPGGQIFCDVNNRHNARAYGPARVMLRRLIDGVAPDERRGDTHFEWVVDGERIPASGHLFTPAEMRGLVLAAQLHAAEQRSIDYMTGTASTDPSAGQLVFRLVAGASVQESS